MLAFNKKTSGTEILFSDSDSRILTVRSLSEVHMNDSHHMPSMTLEASHGSHADAQQIQIFK